MLKQKLSASLIVINALAGLSIASAAFAATPQKPGCREGSVPAPNPQLGCIPNKVKAPGVRQPIKKNSPSIKICPEGFVPATPPLNPQLGCLPNQIKNPGVRQPIKKKTSSQQIDFPPEVPETLKVNKCELGIVDPINCPENNPFPVPRD